MRSTDIFCNIYAMMFLSLDLVLLNNLLLFSNKTHSKHHPDIIKSKSVLPVISDACFLEANKYIGFFVRRLAQQSGPQAEMLKFRLDKNI